MIPYPQSGYDKAKGGTTVHFDRPREKAAARESMRMARPNPMLVTLVYLVVVLLLSAVSAYSDGSLAHIEIGGHMYAIYDVPVWAGSRLMAMFLRILISLVTALLSYGYMAYTLYVSRRQEAGFGDLMLGFSDAGRVIILDFFIGLFVMLWSLLLFIPGIMAAYSYRLAPYILLDNPEIGGREAIRRSKEMMRGHRWELFVCDLSFLGWALLVMLTAGILSVWVTPYRQTTYADRMIGRAHV